MSTYHIADCHEWQQLRKSLYSSIFISYQWTVAFAGFYLCNTQKRYNPGLDLDLEFVSTIKPWCIRKRNCILAGVETIITVNSFFQLGEFNGCNKNNKTSLEG